MDSKLGLFTEYINFCYSTGYHIFDYSPFFRARLSVEFDEHKMQSDYAPSSNFRGSTQRYQRVYVKNKGYRSVHNCQAELVIIVPKNVDPMLYPSDERKLLAWGRFPQSDDIDDKRTIRGHGKELLHIVFSDSLLNNIQINTAEKRYAGISTVDNLQSIKTALVYEGQSFLKFEDGFAQGEFEIDISITSDEGAYAQTRFMVYVTSNTQELRIRRIRFLKLYIMKKIIDKVLVVLKLK